MQRYGMTDYQILSLVNGEELEGLQLQHPFLHRQVPIILGDHVTLEAGYRLCAYCAGSWTRRLCGGATIPIAHV